MSVRNDFGGTGGGGGDVTVSATTGGFFLGVGLGFHGTAYTGELSGNEEAGVPGRLVALLSTFLKQSNKL